MVVVLAEKKDQAKKLATPFEWREQDGFIEVTPCSIFPKGAYITWALGHLVALEEPEAYNEKYKNWVLETLPIIPETFRYTILKDKAKQFGIIKRLVNQTTVSEIIIGTDPGREGEAIARLILNLAGCKKPIKRLWTSSLTKDSVMKAFQSLLPEAVKRPLFYEAQVRAQADWLIGLNTSRAYTIAFRNMGVDGTFSCGRVQTPLLGLICKREEEIESFIPEKFHEVFATFNCNEKSYIGKWFKGTLDRLEKGKAEQLAKHCLGKNALIRNVETERKEFSPPLLYSLSTLQTFANKQYKFPPQLVLDICQKLYLKGYLTYPRTDSQYITEEEAKLLPEILNNLSKYPDYQQYLPAPITSILHNKRFVNKSKVSDHHAIIPTETVPDLAALSDEEKWIYDLIVRSVVAAHYPNAIFDYTTIVTLVDGKFTFRTIGRQLIDTGWHKVIHTHGFDAEGNTGNPEMDEQLPILQLNEVGNVTNCHVHEGVTKAPKRYTEGDLIAVMKSAGKELVDEDLEKVMEETEGLGTEATRSGIITVLKNREYIDVRKNLVFPTRKGRFLIRAIGDSVLSSAILTARWEQRLREIGTGKADAAVFMEQVKILAKKLVQDVATKKDWINSNMIKNVAEKRQHEVDKSNSRGKVNRSPDQNGNDKSGEELGACIRCGSPVIEKAKKYGCSIYPNCDFSISKVILGQTVTNEDMRALLSGDVTDLKIGLKKTNNSTPFDACLVLEAGKLAFRYPSVRGLTLPLNLLYSAPKQTKMAKDHKEEFIQIEKEAESLKYPGKVVGVTIGPRITRYELLPAKGVNYSSYKRFKQNFQAVLMAEKITMHIPIPGKNTIGLEVPNIEIRPVYLRSLLENKEFLARRTGLTFPLGADIEGKPVYGDLSKMPHLLVAGTTGSGKSVFINSVICSLLYACTKEELRFVFIDPKQVELSAYETLPHLLMPIVKEPARAGTTLEKLIDIMMQRYDLFDAAGVKNIGGYNQKLSVKGEPLLPFIVLVIDELADLLMVAENSVEDQVQRLAQLARAAGIHMIIATQRPSKQCLSPVIKSNLPVRIAFSVASSSDSMVILDQPGAEDLLGKGDMLYQSQDAPIRRIQSAFVSDEEIQRVVRHASQY